MKLTRLREWREREDLTQQQLANESGISQDSISNYETGRRDARFSTARRLALALEVEVEDLRDTEEVRRSGVARLTDSARVSAAQSAQVVKIAMRMHRLRRQAKRRAPEWVQEEVERRLQGGVEPLERWALEGVGRELQREQDRRRGKYAGNYGGYLREKISDEFFDFGWMEALLYVSDVRLQEDQEALTDEDLDEMDEVLDEAQDQIDRLRDTIDEYRRSERIGADPREGE